tara:strand:- start:1553 stop:1744 length:192 start_codon:yes stop_codon:yes gene_type:complete
LRKVKKILKSQERSQAWLARKLDITPALLSYWFNEKSKHKPSIEHKLKMADVFNVDVKELFND